MPRDEPGNAALAKRAATLIKRERRMHVPSLLSCNPPPRRRLCHLFFGTPRSWNF